MTDSENSKSDSKSRVGFKSNRLDLAFPHVWLLSGVVISIIILMVVSGWKIVNVEAERQSVAMERVRIEKDREQLKINLQSHETILKELPSLEHKNDEFRTLIYQLSGELKAKQTKLDSLKTQLTSAQESLDRAIAERGKAVSEKEAATMVHEKLKNDIETSRPIAEQLKSEVAQLTEQSSEIQAKVKKYLVKERELSAELAGLEKQKENVKQVLLEMSEDRDELAKLSNRFGSIFDRIEATGENTDKSVKEFQGQTVVLQKAIVAIQDQIENLSGEIKKVGTSSESLNKSSQSLSKSTKTIDTATETVDKTIDQLRTSMKVLETASENVDTQATNLAKTIDLPINSINQLVATLSLHNTNLDTQLKQLNNYSTNLKEKMTEFDINAETLKGHLDAIQRVVTKFDEFNIQMAGTAKEIGSTQSFLTDQSKELTDIISQSRLKIGSESSLISEKLNEIEQLINGMFQQLYKVDEKIKMLENKLNESIKPIEVQ